MSFTVIRESNFGGERCGTMLMSVGASCSYTRWPNLEKALGESKGKIGSRGFRGVKK